MELYDYSLLLKTIKTINTNNVLLEKNRVSSLRAKLKFLENKLINSGVLKDWYALSEVIKKSGANGYEYVKVNYDKHNTPRVSISRMKVNVNYDEHNTPKMCIKGMWGNDIQFDGKARFKMRIYSRDDWGKYFGIDITKCKKRLIWGRWYTTPHGHQCGDGVPHGWWGWFKDRVSECSTKIAIIEKIFEVYEEYRQHVLNAVAEVVVDKRKKGENLANEIRNIKTFIIKEV